MPKFITSDRLSGLLQIINDTLPALAKLRKEGTVRYVGFSGLPLDAFTYILDR